MNADIDPALGYAMNKPKLLVFIVAYNAENTLKNVLTRIPLTLGEEYSVEVLIIDDSSHDRTFEAGEDARSGFAFPLHVLTNPDNQGYGGNQKIGYHFAIENNFDFVALVHGDGQYAPECLPDLVQPLREGTADAVFGSRMLVAGNAIRGGMPLYKFVGNKILSEFENRMLRTRLSEFHSGYRIYAVSALKLIPFDLNTNDFHFDTEIIVQFVVARLRILERPIPTYYGDEICRVNGLKYAWNVTKAVLKARAQELSLFYDRRFDCAPSSASNQQYQIKHGYPSPHSEVLARVKPESSVLDLGCAGGYMGEVLRQQLRCKVTGVDVYPLRQDVHLDQFILHDLNCGPPNLDFSQQNFVLLLDVVEHLATPERFIDQLRALVKYAPNITIFVSTGNVAFFIVRLMLLAGQFNYGKRGILDKTHSRLFTFDSMRRLFEQGGFSVVDTVGIPAPFPLAFGDGMLGRLLLRINGLLIKISRTLFSYQAFMVVRPRPSLEHLLAQAKREAVARNQGRLAA